MVDEREIKTPKSENEAMNLPEKYFWLEAMRNEYSSLMENGTWKLVSRPENKSVLQNK